MLCHPVPFNMPVNDFDAGTESFLITSEGDANLGGARNTLEGRIRVHREPDNPKNWCLDKPKETQQRQRQGVTYRQEENKCPDTEWELSASQPRAMLLTYQEAEEVTVSKKHPQTNAIWGRSISGKTHEAPEPGGLGVGS